LQRFCKQNYEDLFVLHFSVPPSSTAKSHLFIFAAVNDAVMLDDSKRCGDAVNRKALILRKTNKWIHGRE
jgi:hypothetical protein